MRAGGDAGISAWGKGGKGVSAVGYMLMVGRCCACGRMMTFNPYLVPSVKGEPVCRECVEAHNRARRERGLPEFQIPPGAYEAAEEG